MSKTLPLLKGEISLDQALGHDDNILVQTRYPQQKHDFWASLSARQEDIEAIVCFHLGVEICRVYGEALWQSGSYNICIPVHVISKHELRMVLVRIPLPYKIGEGNHPGNVDEKLRCEVASYIWLQENCPDVPIPSLFGFGFPDGHTFTTPEYTPLWTRWKSYAMRILRSWLSGPIPCRYASRNSPPTLSTGYMIISWISDGQMLSNSWHALRHEKSRRSNLFRGLARIILSLTKTPLPSIGSLTLNNQGVVTLTNRPLMLQLQAAENEGIPTISRDSTYPTVESYLQDVLTCHDNRILYQPNSIHDQNDGQQQLAALTAMRATLHHFINPTLRRGPFVFTLTDLHQSNIFVDDEWNITSLIDLEWACSLPIEMQGPPYWLSGLPVDSIKHGERLDNFSEVASQYMEVFEEEERIRGTVYQTPIMRRTWETGAFWYFEAISTPKGLCTIFNEHVQRRFAPKQCGVATFDRITSPYWSDDAADVIQRKIREEEIYKNQLRDAFAAAPEI